jgi:hypothetical protein
MSSSHHHSTSLSWGLAGNTVYWQLPTLFYHWYCHKVALPLSGILDTVAHWSALEYTKTMTGKGHEESKYGTMVIIAQRNKKKPAGNAVKQDETSFQSLAVKGSVGDLRHQLPITKMNKSRNAGRKVVSHRG